MFSLPSQLESYIQHLLVDARDSWSFRCLKQSGVSFHPNCSCSRASGLHTGTCIRALAQTGNLGSILAFAFYLSSPTDTSNPSPTPVISIFQIPLGSYSPLHVYYHNLGLGSQPSLSSGPFRWARKWPPCFHCGFPVTRSCFCREDL